MEGCGSTSCHQFNVHVENFRQGSHKVECWGDGSNGWEPVLNNGYVYTESFGASKSFELSCVFGYPPGKDVAVKIDGKMYERRPW